MSLDCTEFKCRSNYSKVILKGLSKVLNLGASCTTQVRGGERRERRDPCTTKQMVGSEPSLPLLLSTGHGSQQEGNKYLVD